MLVGIILLGKAVFWGAYLVGGFIGIISGLSKSEPEPQPEPLALWEKFHLLSLISGILLFFMGHYGFIGKFSGLIFLLGILLFALSFVVHFATFLMRLKEKTK